MNVPNRQRRTALVLLSAALVLATACSGGPGPTDQKNDSLVVPSSSQGGKALKGSQKASGHTSVPTGRVGTVGGSKTPGDSLLPPGTSQRTGLHYRIPNLFTKAENTIGITDDKIVLCTHAALSLAPIFNVHEEDLNVFWEYVNKDLHGIYGRTVQMSYADDNYGNNQGDAQKAYDTCHAKNPFIMFGGIGFDQIPIVRDLAERDHQLYVHHIASEDPSKKYSFSYLASVNQVGKLAAEFIIAKHPDLRSQTGILYRQSDNWEPGHKEFMAEFASHGLPKPTEAGANKSATVYSTQIKALKDAHAKVVFVWENALSAIEILKQAKQQDFTPQWLVFPFNLETDTLKDEALSPVPLEGIATWPAYHPGVTSGPFSTYATEIKLYEKMQEKYGVGNKDDITWMTWLGWHQVYQLLLDCGPDCTRNKVVGLLQGNIEQPILGGCPFDFARNGHVGGWAVNILRAEMRGGEYGWRNVSTCDSRW